MNRLSPKGIMDQINEQPIKFECTNENVVRDLERLMEKIIEERATESANNATIHKLSDSWYIHRNGYIKGAIEQRAIDIEKFKQWFAKWRQSNEYLPLDVRLKSIDKAMEE